MPKPQKLGLPSAPKPFLTYFEDDTRPQTKLDRDAGNGMGVDHRPAPPGRALRLALRRALAQHRARRGGRRGAHRRAAHRRGLRSRRSSPAPTPVRMAHSRALAPLLAALVLLACGGYESDPCGPDAEKQALLDVVHDWYLYPDTLPPVVDPSLYDTAEDLLEALTAGARDLEWDRDGWDFVTTAADATSLFVEGQSVGFGIGILRRDRRRLRLAGLSRLCRRRRAGARRPDPARRRDRGRARRRDPRDGQRAPRSGHGGRDPRHRGGARRRRRAGGARPREGDVRPRPGPGRPGRHGALEDLPGDGQAPRLRRAPLLHRHRQPGPRSGPSRRSPPPA